MPNPYANAPASIADVCNIALGNIGWLRTISDLTDKSPEAAACARFYPQAIGEISRDTDWPGLTQHLALTQIPPSTLQGGAVSQSWRFAYQLPVGCCRMLGIYPYSQRLAIDAAIDASTPPPQSRWNDNGFRVWHRNPDRYRQIRHVRVSDANVGQIILTDERQPILEFINMLADLTQADPDFIRALALLLSSYLAGTLKRDTSLAAQMLAAYGTALASAVANAHNEENVDPEPLPSFIRARAWGGRGGY